MIDNYIFPFSNIVDEDLFDVFNFGEMFQQEANESFDPLTVQDDNYNNDLDVNQFYIRSRHVEFPKSEYTFLKNFSTLSSNNVFNVLTLNIRSMSTNFQYFKDTVLSNTIIYDVLGFTETRLDAGISLLYAWPTYAVFTNDRNRYGDGVAVSVSNRYTGCNVDECDRIETFIESVEVEVK